MAAVVYGCDDHAFSYPVKVEAPAFMRGKLRFSAAEKGLLDMSRFSAGFMRPALKRDFFIAHRPAKLKRRFPD